MKRKKKRRSAEDAEPEEACGVGEDPIGADII